MYKECLETKGVLLMQKLPKEKSKNIQLKYKKNLIFTIIQKKKRTK